MSTILLGAKMKYNRNLLRIYGSGEVKSIRYRNYPLRNTRFYYGFEQSHLAMPLVLHSTGSDTWHCRGYSERTRSTILALEYVQEGTFVFTQEGVEHQVNAGEMFIVYPGKSSSICCHPVTATKRLVIMRGSMLEFICARLGLDKIDKFVPENRKVIDDLYDEIDTLGKSGTGGDYFRACSLCYNLLVEISLQNSGSIYPPELQAVLDCINSNLFRSVSLQEMIKVSGLSNTSLNQMFHKYLHISPIEFFIDRKLETAKNLLLNTSDSVKEIAAMLEYPSPQYFATKFKEKFGMSPTELRKSGVFGN